MWHCTRCHRRMRRSRWGDWFEHIAASILSCTGQHAYWADPE